MASVWKHPKSPFWTACYNLPDGRRVKQSTGLTNRAEAERVASSLESEARARSGMSEKRARELASRLFELFGGERFAGEAVRAFFDRWNARKSREVAASTARTYRDTSKQFLDFLGSRAACDISSITAREITAFRDGQAARLATGTANRNLKILRIAFADAFKAKLVSANEAASVPVLKAAVNTKEGRRPFTEPELRRLLDVAGQEWRAMILTALYTGGQRLGDVARLNWCNVDLERAEVRLVTRKTGRRQILPMNAPLLACLASLPSSDDPQAPVFPQAAARIAATQGGGVGTLSNQFRELLVLAGLATSQTHEKALNGRNSRRTAAELSFHSLRHTATSWMKDRGVSGPIVQDIVGHDSAAVSAHYTHIDEDTKRAALAMLPDLTAPAKATGKARRAQ